VKIRVLHLPTNVAGVPAGLAEGERMLGLDSESVSMFSDYIRHSNANVMFNKTPNSVWDAIKYVPAILQKINSIDDKYDVFHFNSSRTMLDYLGIKWTSMWDLPHFKRWGKVAVMFNGCDVRMRTKHKQYRYSPCINPLCQNRMCKNNASDEVKAYRVKKWDKYADAMFAATPDLLEYLPERAIYLPNTTTNWDGLNPVPILKRERIRIIHAPTNQIVKGSQVIDYAIRRLKKEFPDRIEYVCLEGMSNANARLIYQTADLIIDQIKMGIYSVVALEAMKMGKPVLAYLDPVHYKKINPDMVNEMNDTIINASPETIYDTLKGIMVNPDCLRPQVEKGLSFVEKWHAPKVVAAITKKEYERMLGDGI